MLGGCAAKPEPVAKVEEPRRSIRLEMPKQVRPGTVPENTAPPISEAPQLALYPGAEPVEGSESTNQDGEFVIVSKSYRTKDSPTQVAKFYREEGVKLGNLITMPKTDENFQTVAFESQTGEKYQVAATKNRDGITLVLVSRRSKR